MLRKTYNYIIDLSKSKYATFALGVIAFLESIIFPIPPDLILIPIALSNRSKAFIYATITTICSVIGGAIGFLIGYAFWVTIGSDIINYLGYETALETFGKLYIRYGILIILVAGLSPFPYKVITIMSGVFGLPFWIFILFSFISRGFRFYTIATLIYFFGVQIQKLLEKHLTFIFITVLVLMLGSYTLITNL